MTSAYRIELSDEIVSTSLLNEENTGDNERAERQGNDDAEHDDSGRRERKDTAVRGAVIHTRRAMMRNTSVAVKLNHRLLTSKEHSFAQHCLEASAIGVVVVRCDV